MPPLITAHRWNIAALCRRFQVRRLEAFGSAARVIDFNPESSDLDFLVEFDATPPPSLDHFLDLREALQRLLGQPGGFDLGGGGAQPLFAGQHRGIERGGLGNLTL